MKTLRHSYYMAVRNLLALARQPYYIAITIVQPIIWLLLFSALFKRVVQIPGFESNSYISFLAPGIVVQSALFSNGWAGMGVIDQLNRGIMDRMLVSPVSRTALILGALAQCAITTMIQSIIIVVLGWILGAHYPGGIAGVALLIFGAALLGSAIASLSIALALVVRREESVIAASSFVVLPLSFLSSAFMQLSLVTAWIQSVARWNPVDWTVSLGRSAIGENPDWGLVWSRGFGLLLVAGLCVMVATRAFRSYQRSV